MTESIYIIFDEEYCDYQPGDIFLVSVCQRDSRGVQVEMSGEGFRFWSDLAPLRELTSLEIIAAAADDRLVLDELV